MEPRIEAVDYYPVSIFMAGDYEEAKTFCREFCDEVGLCVTVTKTSYVYTGGDEDGVIVGLINYPRFPSTHLEILTRAVRLAEKLRVALHQQSFTVQSPEGTVWYSYRPEDIKTS